MKHPKDPFTRIRLETQCKLCGEIKSIHVLRRKNGTVVIPNTMFCVTHGVTSIAISGWTVPTNVTRIDDTESQILPRY